MQIENQKKAKHDAWLAQSNRTYVVQEVRKLTGFGIDAIGECTVVSPGFEDSKQASAVAAELSKPHGAMRSVCTKRDILKSKETQRNDWKVVVELLTDAVESVDQILRDLAGDRARAASIAVSLAERLSGRLGYLEEQIRTLCDNLRSEIADECKESEMQVDLFEATRELRRKLVAHKARVEENITSSNVCIEELSSKLAHRRSKVSAEVEELRKKIEMSSDSMIEKDKVDSFISSLCKMQSEDYVYHRTVYYCMPRGKTECRTWEYKTSMSVDYDSDEEL
jgi:hypothetical protein